MSAKIISDQDSIFWKSEGDRWFERNSQRLESLREDMVLTLLKKKKLKPKNVLEIGASNGWRLALIKEALGSRCVGVEPGKKAVQAGNKLKGIKMIRGIASKLPLKEQFDLVIVVFVLHWISRDTLLKSVAEIDRVTKDGGYLLVGDFLPDAPVRTHYHHLKKGQAYTFKQRYPDLFTATGLYELVDEVVFDHGDLSRRTNIESKNRCSLALLRKKSAYKDATAGHS